LKIKKRAKASLRKPVGFLKSAFAPAFYDTPAPGGLSIADATKFFPLFPGAFLHFAS